MRCKFCWRVASGWVRCKNSDSVYHGNRHEYGLSWVDVDSIDRVDYYWAKE